MTMQLDMRPDIESPAPTPRAGNRQWISRVWRIALPLFFIALAIAIAEEGLKLRRFTWDYTSPIRYVPDMENAFSWAQRSAREGYLNLYERRTAEQPDRQYSLDYVPLRLAVMTIWGKWLQSHYPGINQWQNEYDFNRPLLEFNLFTEAAAAILAFLLTWLWVVRSADRGGLPKWWMRGLFPGLIAAALIWLNPGMVISSFGRPTWDVWIIPFYLGAVLLASLDWWFWAGAILAIGAMFKGQQLAVVPIFLLWPIFSAKWGAALRWLIGFVFATAIIVSPWMITTVTFQGDLADRRADVTAITWIASVAVITAIIMLVRAKARPLRWYVWLAMGAFLFSQALWPAFARDKRDWLEPLAGLAVILFLAAARLSPRRLPLVLAAVIGTGLLLCMGLFHGSTAWFDVSFVYGVEKFPQLTLGGPDSLAALLQHRYQWHSDQPVWIIAQNTLWHWPDHDRPVTINEFLAGIYLLTAILSAIGLAIHGRRRDLRFLAAVATPWICFFTLAPQMHERYLLWGAAAAACAGGVSLGMALFCMLMMTFSGLMTIQVMLQSGNRLQFASDISPDFGQSLSRFIGGTYPDLAWAMLLLAGVYLYLSLAFRRRPKPLMVEAA